MKIDRRELLSWAAVAAFSIGSAAGQEAAELYREPVPLVALAATGEAREPESDAVVRLRIVARAGSLAQAISTGNEYRSQIIAELARAGILRENIHTEKFSSHAECRAYSGNGKGYALVNFLEVTIFSESQFLAIARVVDRLPALEFESRRIERDEDRSLERAAVKEAMDALMKRARQYEAAFGVKLTLVSFSEAPVVERGGRYDVVAPPLPGSIPAEGFVATSVPPGPAVSLTTEFGEITRVAGVHGLFALERQAEKDSR